MNGIKIALSVVLLGCIGDQARAVELRLNDTVSAIRACSQNFALCPQGGTLDFVPNPGAMPTVVRDGAFVVTHRLVGRSMGDNVAYGDVELPFPASVIGPGGPWNFWDLYFFYLPSNLSSAHVVFDPKISAGHMSNTQARIVYVSPWPLDPSVASQQQGGFTISALAYPDIYTTSVGWSSALDTVTDLAAGIYILEVRGNVIGRRPARFRPFYPADGTYYGLLSISAAP